VPLAGGIASTNPAPNAPVRGPMHSRVLRPSELPRILADEDEASTLTTP
jgi:hypothetical protein